MAQCNAILGRMLKCMTVGYINITIWELSVCLVHLVCAHKLFFQHQKVTLEKGAIYLTALLAVGWF